MKTGGFLIFLMLVFSLATAAGHPHVNIDYNMDIHFCEQGLDSLHVELFFDEFFSKQLLAAFDIDKDSTLQPAEVARLYQLAFKPALEQGFFVRIVIDDQHYAPKLVTDFSANISAGLLVYSFQVSCRISAGPTGRTVSVGLIDEAHYLSFGLNYLDDWPAAGQQYELSFTSDRSYYSHRNSQGGIRTIIYLHGTENSGEHLFFGCADRQTALRPVASGPLRPECTMSNPLLAKQLELAEKAVGFSPIFGH